MKTLQLTIERNQKIINVSLTGSIVSIDAFELRYALSTLIEQGQDLVLNLEHVNEISITGLNALLMTKVELNKQGSKMSIIAKEDSDLFNYLHLTKMSSEFQVILSKGQSIAA